MPVFGAECYVLSVDPYGLADNNSVDVQASDGQCIDHYASAGATSLRKWESPRVRVAGKIYSFFISYHWLWLHEYGHGLLTLFDLHLSKSECSYDFGQEHLQVYR